MSFFRGFEGKWFDFDFKHFKDNFIPNNFSNLNKEKPHRNHHHEESLFPFPFSYLPLKILGSNWNLLVTTKLMCQFLFLSGFPLDFFDEFFLVLDFYYLCIVMNLVLVFIETWDASYSIFFFSIYVSMDVQNSLVSGSSFWSTKFLVSWRCFILFLFGYILVSITIFWFFFLNTCLDPCYSVADALCRFMLH